MDNFFRSIAPVTAYDYSTGTKRNNSTTNNVPTMRLAPLHGRVVCNQRMTADNWYQDVRHIRIEVDTASASLTERIPLHLHSMTKPYNAGDVAVVMPRNSDASVQRLLNVLPQHIQSIADKELFIERLTPAATLWPSRCTLRSLLTYCADINGLPERECLRSLSVFVDTQRHPEGKEQAQKLIDLSESSGSALYADYILRERRTYADVFFDFDAIRFTEQQEEEQTNEVLRKTNHLLNIEHILGLIPPMIPRQFSIASSPSTKEDVQPHFSPHPETSFVVELCVAVVQGKTPLGRRYKGLCSSFLANLNCESSTSGGLPQWQNFPKLRLWIRPGSFERLPLSINEDTGTFERPIMCIGAGTGIAPIRALLRERFTTLQNACSTVDSQGHHLNKDHPLAQHGCNILIFGCRKKNADFYYSHEWQEAVDRGSLRLLTAFSQDQRHKVYVQNLVRDDDGRILLVSHLLKHGGALYIAGGAKMARAVKDEIVEVLGDSLDGGVAEAKHLLKKLHYKGLMSVEAWS